MIIDIVVIIDINICLFFFFFSSELNCHVEEIEIGVFWLHCVI